MSLAAGSQHTLASIAPRPSTDKGRAEEMIWQRSKERSGWLGEWEEARAIVIEKKMGVRSKKKKWFADVIPKSCITSLAVKIRRKAII